MKKMIFAASLLAIAVSGCSSLGIDKSDMLEKAFALYDSNSDDKVDLAEVDVVNEAQSADDGLVAKAESEGFDWREYSAKLFADQDGDSDGFLSRSEFAGYLKALK